MHSVVCHTALSVLKGKHNGTAELSDLMCRPAGRAAHCDIEVYKDRKLYNNTQSDIIDMTAITIIVVIAGIIACNAQLPGDESCETLPSEIHLIKGR